MGRGLFTDGERMYTDFNSILCVLCVLSRFKRDKLCEIWERGLLGRGFFTDADRMYTDGTSLAPTGRNSIAPGFNPG